MLALEIFGPLLIAGINSQHPTHLTPTPSAPPPLLRLFLAISSFDKDWNLLRDRAGIHLAETPLAVRLDSSEGRWGREEPPL